MLVIVIFDVYMLWRYLFGCCMFLGSIIWIFVWDVLVECVKWVVEVGVGLIIIGIGVWGIFFVGWFIVKEEEFEGIMVDNCCC